jgi:phosphoribosylformimino-5-aminoimidazole carboxamide ribotide isomerase
MDILPAIDLRNGRCVRLLQGDYGRQIDYADDPVAQARAFAAGGATWLHVVDLDGAREGVQRNVEVIRRICAETRLQVEVGGGVRDDAAVETLLGAGAARAVIGTRAFEDWDWFRSLVHDPRRAGKVVLALDCREGRVAVHGWTETTERLVIEVAEAVAGWPLGAIIYTDISRDGMLLGPNMEAIRALAEASAVPIVASGGVTSIDDVRRLVKLPLSGVIIGRALYENEIDLREAVAVAGGAA